MTFAQAAELLGIGEAAVRSLVSEGEIRAVTVQTYGRQRIPRVEIDEYVARLLTGQLRAWVEARRDLEQWGLRYMGDRRFRESRLPPGHELSGPSEGIVGPWAFTVEITEG